MSADLVPVAPAAAGPRPVTAGAVAPARQTEWTEQQHAALDALDVPKIPSVRALLFETVMRTGLDPFARQIYVARRNSGYKIETTIDGFRAVAERQQTYAGQDGPYWCGPDGRWVDVWLANYPPAAAKVGIYRHGFAAPLYAVARFSEYVGMTKDDNGNSRPNYFWNRMPALMVAKVAEALGLRRAYPMVLGGLYTADEMSQAEQSSAQVERRAEPAPAIERQHLDETPPTARHAVGSAVKAAHPGRIEQIMHGANRWQLLDDEITAPDTGRTDTLREYLRRRWYELRDQVQGRRMAAEHAAGLPTTGELTGQPPSVPLDDYDAPSTADGETPHSAADAVAASGRYLPDDPVWANCGGCGRCPDCFGEDPTTYGYDKPWPPGT